MTLGNIRRNGMRSVEAYCYICHHQTVLSADCWPDDLAVPWFKPRMVCTPLRHYRRCRRAAELERASAALTPS
jgi:hypothetical protein